MDARSAREWSSEASARAICPASLRRRCCISHSASVYLSPWNFVTVGFRKLRVMPVPDTWIEFDDDMCICFDAIRACDGQTDGQICCNNIVLCMHRHRDV